MAVSLPLTVGAHGWLLAFREMHVVTLLSGLVLGLLLGIRHALEPDHLAAVSTIVVKHRRPGGGVLVGAFWGLGHTVALFAVGFALAMLHTQMPARLSDAFELAVAFMLVALGARAVGQAVRTGQHGPFTRHHHGHLLHRHAGHEEHVHVGPMTLARRPLIIGLMHGLAGSGALTALAIAKMPTMSARLLFMALFGLGSVLGMAFLTGLAGWPLSRISKDPRVERGLSIVTGTFSLVLGVCWGWPIAREFLLP